MTGRRPLPERVAVPVKLLRALEAYLGDQPHRDPRAANLHETLVKLMIAEGLL